jgi:hypothetical protein
MSMTTCTKSHGALCVERERERESVCVSACVHALISCAHSDASNAMALDSDDSMDDNSTEGAAMLARHVEHDDVDVNDPKRLAREAAE